MLIGIEPACEIDCHRFVLEIKKGKQNRPVYNIKRSFNNTSEYVIRLYLIELTEIMDGCQNASENNYPYYCIAEMRIPSAFICRKTQKDLAECIIYAKIQSGNIDFKVVGRIFEFYRMVLKRIKIISPYN